MTRKRPIQQGGSRSTGTQENYWCKIAVTSPHDSRKLSPLELDSASRRLWLVNDWSRFEEAIEVVTGANARRVISYQRLLFQDVDIRGKSLLDVGGGTGVMAFYGALCGANRVVCLEPSAAGSNQGVQERFERIRSKTDLDVKFVTGRIQTWSEPFDIVLMNNVVNHLDEDVCRRLHIDARARSVYRSHLEHVADVTKKWLIVGDCSRSSFLAALGVHNPFAPSIEWEKHQRPELWAQMFESLGFRTTRLRWNASARLGKVGQAILGNRVGAYLTNAHFILTLERESGTSHQS